MKPLVAPSILSADFANLQRDIEMINRSDGDWIHIDVMDGVFVPNISLGLPIVKAIQRHAQKPMDVHLMIQKPENYLSQFRDAGADHIYVHYEACNHLHRVVGQIKELGCKAGVAINPHTPISLLRDIIQDVDQVCVMSVNPGFGGQSFIENTYPKVRELKSLILEKETSTLIEVDGGVNLDNAPLLVDAGVDILVTGSFIFKAPQPETVIRDLKNVRLDKMV